MRYMLFLVRVNRQLFCKFLTNLATSGWEFFYVTRKFWNEKIENFHFLKFELKFFVFDFWKNLYIPPEGDGKIKKWFRNSKKIWPYHQRETKKIEIYHENLKWKKNNEIFILKFKMKKHEIWNEKFRLKKWPYHQREMKKFEMKKLYIPCMPPR
jgi:hypothetical protein